MEKPEKNENSMILSSQIFESGSDIYMNLHTQENNSSYHLLHGHDFFEMNYVISGTARQSINQNQSIELKQGMLCIMNPNARHNLYVEHPEDMVLNIDLKTSLFNSTFWTLIEEQGPLGEFFLNYFLSRDVSENFVLLHFCPSENIDHMVEDILTEYLQKQDYSQVALRCLLILFFTEVMRQNARLLNQKTFENKTAVQITALFNYLSRNYATATLKSTAAFFHYHPNYLSRFVKQHTGHTFRNILNDIKVSQCTYYLINTNLPISEISERLGFKQMCNFYDFTKKNFHMTPIKYRQSGQGTDTCP
ncbi:MAG: AraC family transcriptional regulator [Oliverpabstia sp.]